MIMISRALAPLLLVTVALDARADIQEDLASGMSFIEVVEAARADGMSPTVLTQALIDAGQPPARGAYGVAFSWKNCGATLEAVAAAARADADAVEPIITTMAGLQTCGCSAESAWAQARLDVRIRTDSLINLPIELSDACGCLTAAVEAAVAVRPAKADRIVRSAVEAAETASYAEDSVGQRFSDDTRLFESSIGQGTPKIFRRKKDACEVDRDELDEFDLTEAWEESPAGDYRDIGRFETDCDDEFDSLVISEFNAEPGVGTYVELYNGTDETIELGAQGYNLTMFFAGLDGRGHSVELMGPVAPGRTFVVADADAPELVLRRADFVVPQLSFYLGDAMTVHSDWSEENCQCAEAVVASSLRAPTDDPLGVGPIQTSMVHHKVERIYGQVPRLMPGQVVDAIGQVDWHEEYTADTPILSKLLRRDQAACRGDSNELDAFRTDPVFAASDTPDLTNAGIHSSRCRTAQHDILISEFVTVEDDLEAIELHNPLPADINLEYSGYVLELYRPGDRTPFQVFELRGTIEGGGNFLVATADALDEIDSEADLTVDRLQASQSSAVVLKKLNVPTPMRCSVPVAAALDVLLDASFTFINDPTDPGVIGQTPPSVDRDASPN